MPTVTKLFPFATGLDGWTANGGMYQTLGYDSAAGNPSGSLKASASTPFVSTTGYFEWAGTWENLGVPAGQIVQSIRLDAGYDKADATATGMAIGPYSLYQGGVAQATLKAARNPVISEFSWQTITSQSDQPVSSAINASSTTIQLRVYFTSPTGSNTTAHMDQLQYVITYGTAANPWPGRQFPAKPIAPVLDRNNQLAKGLILDLPYWEGVGPGRNIVTGQTGTVNGVGWTRNGPFGFARDNTTLGGSNYETYNHPSYAITSSSFEVWLTARQFQTAYPYISGVLWPVGGGIGCRFGDATSGSPYLLELIGGGFTSGSSWFSSTTFQTNQVYHVVVVTQGTSGWIYVNGNLDNSFTGLPTNNTASTSTQVFVDDTASRNMNGSIHCVRRWNRPLSAQEVARLYVDPWSLYTAPSAPEIWLPYAYGSGSSSVAATSTHATISASGSFALVNRTGTVGPLFSHPTIDSSSTFVVPVYVGVGSVSATHATLSSAASSTVPAYHSNTSASVTHPSISTSSHFLVPTYNGSGSLAKQSTLSSSSAFVKPVYAGTFVVTANHATLSASSGFVVPVYHGTLAGTTTHPTITASATQPYKGAAPLTTSHPTIAIFATRAVPVYTGNMGAVSTKANFSSSSHEAANYYGSMSSSATHFVFGAGATFVVPVYHGVMSSNANHASIASQSAFVIPVYHGSSANISNHVSVSISASFVVPVYHGASSVSVTHWTLAATAVFPRYFGALSVVTNHAALSSSATFSVPVYVGNMASVSSNATLLGAAQHQPPIYQGNCYVYASSSLIVGNGLNGPHADIITKGYGVGQRIATKGYHSFVPLTNANSSVTAKHVTLAVVAHFSPPSYVSTCLLSSHPFITALATFAIPVYHGSAAFSRSVAFDSSAISVVPAFSSNSGLTVGHPQITSAAVSSVPVYTSNSSLELSTVFVSLGGSVAPNYHADLDTDINHPVINASGVSTVPTYQATATGGTVTILVSAANSSVPVYSADLLVATATLIAATGAFVIPVYQGGALLSRQATISATGVFSVPVYQGACGAVASHPTIDSTGGLDEPTFAGECDLIVGPIVFLGSSKETIDRFGDVSLVIGRLFVSDGSAVVPIYHGNATYTRAKIVTKGWGGGVSAIVTKGYNSGIYGLKLTNVVFSGAATMTHNFLGNAILWVHRPFISTHGSTIYPVYTGNSTNVTSSVGFADGSASFSVPSYSADATLSAQVDFNTHASWLGPPVFGYSGITVTHVTLSASASCLLPQYASSATLTLAHPTLESFGVFYVSDKVVVADYIITNSALPAYFIYNRTQARVTVAVAKSVDYFLGEATLCGQSPNMAD